MYWRTSEIVFTEETENIRGLNAISEVIEGDGDVGVEPVDLPELEFEAVDACDIVADFDGNGIMIAKARDGVRERARAAPIMTPWSRDITQSTVPGKKFSASI